MYFQFLDYYTEYSSEGGIKKRLAAEACFSKIFCHADATQCNTYKIILYNDSTQIDNHHNNFCPFTKRQILHHLKLLQSIVEFEYQVSKRKNTYIIEVTINKKCNMYHRYLVTWIRYLYEWPFNMYLLDTYRLSKICKGYTIENLFNTVNAVGYQRTKHRDIHQVTQGEVQRLSKSSLKEKLHQVDRLNSIYKTLNERSKFILPASISSHNYNKLEYWNEDNFNNIRKQLYLNYLKEHN